MWTLLGVRIGKTFVVKITNLQILISQGLKACEST